MTRVDASVREVQGAVLERVQAQLLVRRVYDISSDGSILTARRARDGIGHKKSFVLIEFPEMQQADLGAG